MIYLDLNMCFVCSGVFSKTLPTSTRTHRDGTALAISFHFHHKKEDQALGQ